MKRTFLRAAACSIAAALLLCPCKAMSLSAQSAIVTDGATGRVLYEKNADEKSLIASTTKIMTGLLICQQCSPESRVQIPKEAVNIEGSSMYLQAGEILSVRELLYGLMLRSGNDAAVALAMFCDGSVEAFARRMNEKAQALGLHSTHFANPHGLDDSGNYSTARDMAVLAAYAMDDPEFRRIVATKSVTVGSRHLVNHNKLLWQYDGAVGVKTGYTKAAGRILVSAAERNGRRIIAVTVNAPNDWADHKKLLDFGFSAYRSVPVLTKGEAVLQVRVLGSSRKTVHAAPAESFSCPVAQDETISLQLHLPRFLFAPVEAGSHAGRAVILADGKPVGETELFWLEDAKPQKPDKLSVLRRRLGG